MFQTEEKKLMTVKTLKRLEHCRPKPRLRTLSHSVTFDVRYVNIPHTRLSLKQKSQKFKD